MILLNCNVKSPEIFLPPKTKRQQTQKNYHTAETSVTLLYPSREGPGMSQYAQKERPGVSQGTLNKKTSNPLEIMFWNYNFRPLNMR